MKGLACCIRETGLDAYGNNDYIISYYFVTVDS